MQNLRRIRLAAAATFRSNGQKIATLVLRSSSVTSIPVSSYCSNATVWPKRNETGIAGPTLKDFLVAGRNLPDPKRTQQQENAVGSPSAHPYLLDERDWHGAGRRVYFEVYGCQMNVSDTEIVWTILQRSGYAKVEDIREADIVMVITCAIREGAETKVRSPLANAFCTTTLQLKTLFEIRSGIASSTLRP